MKVITALGKEHLCMFLPGLQVEECHDFEKLIKKSSPDAVSSWDFTWALCVLQSVETLCLTSSHQTLACFENPGAEKAFLHNKAEKSLHPWYVGLEYLCSFHLLLLLKWFFHLEALCLLNAEEAGISFKNWNTCILFTWWASTKFPLKTQETSSDSGGESIIGMREFCWCGLALLSNSLKPDTLLVLPSARQNSSVYC